MRIDFHTHCFPDALAVKAVSRLSHVSGGLLPHTDGTVAGLRRSMVEGGVNASVVLHIATNPTQQKKVNDFAASIHNGVDIFSFGSVHPDAPDALEELERIKALGLPGVKLHPDYQGFAVDDERMKPIYRKISDLGLVTVSTPAWTMASPRLTAVCRRRWRGPSIGSPPPWWRPIGAASSAARRCCATSAGGTCISTPPSATG